MAEQQNTRRWEHARPPETPQGSSRPEPGHHQLLVAPTLPWVSTRPPLTKRSPPQAVAGCFGVWERLFTLPPPSGLTFLEDDGLAQLLGADGEVLLLAGGDDGLQVVVAFLWGSRAPRFGAWGHTAHPGLTCRVWGTQFRRGFTQGQTPAPTTQPDRAKAAPGTCRAQESKSSSKKKRERGTKSRVLSTAGPREAVSHHAPTASGLP